MGLYSRLSKFFEEKVHGKIYMVGKVDTAAHLQIVGW